MIPFQTFRWLNLAERAQELPMWCLNLYLCIIYKCVSRYSWSNICVKDEWELSIQKMLANLTNGDNNNTIWVSGHDKMKSVMEFTCQFILSKMNPALEWWTQPMFDTSSFALLITHYINMNKCLLGTFAHIFRKPALIPWLCQMNYTFSTLTAQNSVQMVRQRSCHGAIGGWKRSLFVFWWGWTVDLPIFYPDVTATRDSH